MTSSLTSLPEGRSVGHYQIVSLLGAGGMGEVYLAHDPRLDRRVALKLLPADYARDEARVRRFVHEAKAVSALNHPNIITIHEIGEVQTETGAAHYLAGGQELAATEGAVGIQLAGKLWRFWLMRSHLSEGREWLATMLAMTAGEQTAARAKALMGAGTLAQNQSDFDLARKLFEEGLTIYRELGDRSGVAASLTSLGWMA